MRMQRNNFGICWYSRFIHLHIFVVPLQPKK